VQHLSPFEVRLVDEIYKMHGHRDQLGAGEMVSQALQRMDPTG